MGKVPVKLREVVYTLSPFQMTIMDGLWKDVPQKIHRKISEVRQYLMGIGERL
jgi:Cytochrome b-c1 complex subunit 8